jgi:DNA-binding transcriptional LysR family regulator
MTLHLELAIRHGGIVATHHTLATHAGLLAINVPIDLVKLPIYLVSHRDIQHNKNMRTMMDFLIAELPKALL